MKALLAALTAILSVAGATYLIEQLQPGVEQTGATHTISSVVTEARALALLDDSENLGPYLEQAASDILANRDGVTIADATVTVRTDTGCWQATVPTTDTPLEITECQ